MVHVPAKFRENTSMRFRVTVQKLNVTDGRTDKQADGGGGGGCKNTNITGNNDHVAFIIFIGIKQEANL